MILELLAALLGAFLVSALGHVLIVGARNRQTYQFFKKNAPGLKVLENPNLFGGHSTKMMFSKYHWIRTEQLLKEHGPTFGFFLGNQPAAVTIDMDFIKTFTVDEQMHTNRVKLHLPITEIEDDCIMFAKDDQWLRLRKAIAPAFSAHKIKSSNVQADIERIVGKVVEMIDRRLDNEAQVNADKQSIEVDAEDIAQRYALALVFSNFYKQHDVIDFESEEDFWVQLIDVNLKNVIERDSFFFKACAAFPIIRPVVNWLILNFHSQGVARNIIMNYIKAQTKLNFEAAKQAQELLREKKGSAQLGKISEGLAGFESVEQFTLKDGSKFKRNMIDYITDQYREGKLTKSEYFNSTFFLFLAADKTASDGLARLFFNLAHHPQVQEKLRASVRELGVDSEYLGWVVNETLRRHPPAPVGCSRTLKRDIQTKHGLVPAGTFVMTPARAINRMKEYWGQDADDFRPERWADAKNFHPCQYLSFGGGRRACPGKELALMEMKMLVAELIQRYKFDKSQVHTIDNSDTYDTPIFSYLVFDTPTFVRISRV